MGRLVALLLVGVALAFGLDWFLNEFIEEYWVRIIKLCGISIILAVSLNVINGLCGQFSLGHAGFMAIGAYVSALFTTSSSYIDTSAGKEVTRESFAVWFAGLFDSGIADATSEQIQAINTWGFLPGLVAGGVVAAFAGAVVGIPTLRLKGDYLAIATLGFGEIVRILISTFDSVGAAKGLAGLPNVSSTFWIYSFVVIVIVLSLNLQRSTYGRALIAVRENELAAEVMGVPVARLKVTAFIYGAFFAGVAGGLLGHLLRTINPATFNFMKSVEVVVMLVLGGLGSLTGAVVGAVVLTILPESLRDIEREADLPGIRMVIYALVLILLMIFRPQGLFGQKELSLKLFRRLIPGRRVAGDETPKPSEDRKETEL